MQGVDPEAFSDALAKIKDGFIFENFAQGFLSKVLGYDFMPVGGLKDRGIDGLEHMFHRAGVERAIFQISIERDPETKLRKTLAKLCAAVCQVVCNFGRAWVSCFSCPESMAGTDIVSRWNLTPLITA